MEMVVVVAIILLTIGILLPCYLKALHLAHRTASPHGASQDR